MARPTRSESVVLKVRDRKIFNMISQGYPLPYVASVFNLSKGRLAQIFKAYNIKVKNQRSKEAAKNNEVT